MHALKLVVAQTMAFDNLNGPTTESMCSTYRSLFTENTPQQGGSTLPVLRTPLNSEDTRIVKTDHSGLNA